jgi:periplasmic divalent cation tolerance protein
MPDTDPAQAQIALCTCPNREVAGRLASILVDEGLAACVNILPEVTSVYRWEGRMQQDSEALLIIKSTSDRLDTLITRVSELHPYEVPEVIAHPITAGHEPYLNWIRACTEPKR